MSETLTSTCSRQEMRKQLEPGKVSVFTDGTSCNVVGTHTVLVGHRCAIHLSGIVPVDAKAQYWTCALGDHVLILFTVASVLSAHTLRESIYTYVQPTALTEK